MECRRSLLLAMTLGACALGCATQRGSSGSAQARHEAAAEQRSAEQAILEARAAPRAKRDKPSPSLCVALGNIRVEAAADQRRSPAERQLLQDQARKAYQKALELDVKYVPAHLALARLYDDSSDHVRALDHYRQAVRVNAKDAAVHFERGMSHARYKEFDLAVEALRTAAALEPDNRHYAKTLGFCLARAGRFQESMTCLQRQMSEAEAHYNLALMLRHLNQAEASQQHLVRALELDPQLVGAQDLLMQIQQQAGTIQQAVHTEPQPR